MKSLLFNRHNLSSILVNNKIDKIEPINRSGVYMFECNDCEAIYIVQSGRSFKIRYSEHMRSLRQLQSSNSPFNSTSSFADHLIKDNHSPSPNNPQPLHFAPKGPKLDILESAEIKKAIFNNQTILNNQQDIKSSTIIDLLFK